MAETEITKDSNPISGFWRRFLAFVLDMLVLGLVGAVIGFFLFALLAALGGWGRIIGFCIALGYFGVMNSRVCHGQTLGKAVMKIRVVSNTGAPIGVPAALGRSAILCIPYFLNGAPFAPELLQSWFAMVLTAVIFGVGISIVYLVIFNRKTRQSLHDLAVGSYVVRVSADMTSFASPAPWRGHFVIVAAFLIVAAIAPMLMSQLAEKEPFVHLLPIQKTLAEEPGVRGVTVQVGSSFSATMQKGRQSADYLSVRIFSDTRDVDRERLANRVVEMLLGAHADAARKDVIGVSIAYGYDIGIASAWESKSFSFSPAQWRERIAGKK
jgi:uncharacterized RDD family membrane protein YckC